jgi:hypothetical protein
LRANARSIKVTPRSSRISRASKHRNERVINNAWAACARHQCLCCAVVTQT